MAMGYIISSKAKADALDSAGENYMFGDHFQLTIDYLLLINESEFLILNSWLLS